MLGELVSIVFTEIGVAGADHFSKKGNANKRSKSRIAIFFVCVIAIVLSSVFILRYGY